MPRMIRLVNVQEDNKNKFYNMTESTDGSSWTAHWGRVGGVGESQIYPISQWDKKYKEKKKKGYTDITELVSVEKDTVEPEIQILGVSANTRDLINFLQSCARGVVKQNYTVRVADVTEKQIDAAQAILDHLAAFISGGTWDREEINKNLLALYTTIPRKMSDTKKFLVQQGEPKTKFNTLLSNEVDLLDVMRGQVATKVTPTAVAGAQNLKLDITIEDALPADMDVLRRTDLDFSKIGRVFRVTNPRTQMEYQGHWSADKRSSGLLLYHGSRNENWWSIINSGLRIRPTNAIHSGSMFGDGIYFANKARKSIGYTSLSGSYWANGSSNKAYLALYDVNVGSMWDVLGKNRYSGSMSGLNLGKVKSAGYDTVFAKGGADLRNDEHIIYEGPRCTVRYLVELKG